MPEPKMSEPRYVVELRAEHDALLAVAKALIGLCKQSQYQMDRLHQELQERLHDAEVFLANSDVQQLVKEAKKARISP